MSRLVRAGPRGVIYGGALQAEDLNERPSRERGEEALAHWRGFRGCSPGNFFKIYVSVNAFQAILKPFFPYSITSVLSKVRHSNPNGVLPIFSHIRRRKLFFRGSKF